MHVFFVCVSVGCTCVCDVFLLGVWFVCVCVFGCVVGIDIGWDLMFIVDMEWMFEDVVCCVLFFDVVVCVCDDDVECVFLMERCDRVDVVDVFLWGVCGVCMDGVFLFVAVV